MYNGLVVLPVILSFVGPAHRPIQPVEVNGGGGPTSQKNGGSQSVIPSEQNNGVVLKSSSPLPSTKRDEVMIWKTE